MSGLGKVPSFEPDENYKELIGKMFEEKQEDKKKDLEDKKNVRHRLKLPDPPKQTDEQKEFSIRCAKEEMENLRVAFLDFTDKVNDSVVYAYLYSEIEKFVEACQDMAILIEDDIDKDKLSQEGLEYHNKMQKLRLRILNDVYNKYKGTE
ncbi:hypothetical protein QO179_24130 [Bacillus stercoris]|nr:hypothetical protein [Bacillus stercoris]